MFYLTRIVLFLLLLNCACAQRLIYTPKLDSTEYINHRFFSLGYDESVEQARWTYYILEDGQANGKYPRLKNFLVDPAVSTGSLGPRDYRGLGVDRGHLVPALDMSFNSDAMFSSFYMSNVSPQYASFNRGIWKKLESKIRVLSKHMSLLHIYTGPLFLSKLQKVGQITIPSHFYKIVFIEHDDAILTFSFIIKNEKQYNSLSHFMVSIDQIEEISKIDFFSQIEEHEQGKFEKKINKEIWKSIFKEK